MDAFNDGYAKGAEVAGHAFGSVINEYVSENERLRELVSEMWDVLECDVDCVIVCEHFGECDWGRACVFKTRMRELGFEVQDERT